MLFCHKNHKSSHWRRSVKEAIHKKLRQFQRKIPVLESLFNKVTGLRVGVFLWNLRNFSRTSILKNICERLLLKISALQKKLFIDFFHKIMISIIITLRPWSLFCPFVQFLLIYFIKIFAPPFFVNLLLLN